MKEGEGLVLRLDKPIKTKTIKINNELVTLLVNIKELSTIIIVHHLLQFSHTSLTTLDQNLTFCIVVDSGGRMCIKSL